MCKLVIMKATMGAILVLISPVIFGSVMIDAVGNKCIFLDPNGEQITITNPDKIKVVQRGGNPARATCQDADEDVTSDGGRPIFFEGGWQSVNNCAIYDGSKFTSADYKQKTDKNGTTLNCQGVEPPDPQ